MVRMVIVASSLALAVAAAPAVAGEPCSGAACKEAGAASTETTSAAACTGTCQASCSRETVPVAGEACTCEGGACRNAVTVADKAAECLEKGKATSKAIRLTLERLPIVGLSLGFTRHDEAETCTGVCPVSGAATVAVSDAPACCAACASTETVTVEAKSACDCNSCCAAKKAEQQAAVGIPMPGVSRAFIVTRPVAEPRDVMVHTAGLDVPAGPAHAAMPLPSQHHRYQLHIVDQSIYMFDPVSGSLYEPGDAGNWMVRAQLHDAP